MAIKRLFVEKKKGLDNEARSLLNDARTLLGIDTLEKAGYEAYVVGGCVRDALLGLTPHDYDLCTNALPEDIARLFDRYTLVRSGEKHGTIGVVMGKEVLEITTFRTEGGYQDSRHPDWVRFVTHIEEDLARRDFTIESSDFDEKGFSLGRSCQKSLIFD